MKLNLLESVTRIFFSGAFKSGLLIRNENPPRGQSCKNIFFRLVGCFNLIQNSYQVIFQTDAVFTIFIAQNNKLIFNTSAIFPSSEFFWRSPGVF